jgi:hypothetical protein
MSRIFLHLSFLFLLIIPVHGYCYLAYLSFANERPGQIKGSVVDGETKVPIEYANVSLFLTPDTIPIQITATNGKGEFSFSSLATGKYTISVHFMSFKDFTTQPITLSTQMPVIRLEPIPIQEDAVQIKEITVRANQKKPSYQLDKKTIYVENQLSGSGGSAADLLYKIPSVTQTPTGKIAIHGNSNLLIFINGKPSALKGDELLQNTPAADVKKIELITSPSAKYDASGSGGIINLITKKNSLEGLNGNVQTAMDHLGGYSSDLLLNYKIKKLNLFAGIDHNKRRNEGNIDYLTNYQSDNIHFTKSGLQTAQRINTGFRSGLDLKLSARDQISVSGNAGRFKTTNSGNWMTESSILNGSQTTPVKSLSKDENNRQGNYGGVDFSFEHKFSQENKFLTLSALWNNVNYDDDYLNLINSIAGKEQMRQSTQLNKDYNSFQANADFNLPAGKAGSIEVGYQLTSNHENEKYRSEQGSPVPQLTSSQSSRYNGTIHAAYGTWQVKYKRMDVKAGIRAEKLNRELKFPDSSYPLNRFDLYPTLNCSFKLDSTQEILLSYSRRTDQLKTIQLDPLPRWYDFYNVMMGNPNLNNEITDKISMNYLKNFQNLNLSGELYFYNTTGKIEIIRSLYQNGIIRNRYENMGNEKTLGLEINAGWIVTPWISLHEKMDFIGSALDVRLNGLSNEKSYNQFYCVTTADFTLSPTTLLELDFSWYGPAMTAQSNIEKVFLAGISFRQQFLNKKMTLTITGRDFLGLYKNVEHIHGEDFEQVMTSHNKFPIRFSLSYKFNHFKRDERRIAKSPVIE